MNTPNEGSSLKHFNFSGWTADQIVAKYENVLSSRENQITDITIAMGTLNETLNNYMEKCTAYVEENDQLKTKLKKKEAILTQELSNKEIMFMRLERKEIQYDELLKKYNDLLQNKSTVITTNTASVVKDNSSITKVNEVSDIIKTQETSHEKETKESNKVSDSSNKNSNNDNKTNILTGDSQTTIKTSARNKLKELKSKTGNATKINFSNLFEANNNTDKEKPKEEVKEEKTDEINFHETTTEPEITEGKPDQDQ